jgi:negative regulator of sigma E activity
VGELLENEGLFERWESYWRMRDYLRGGELLEENRGLFETRD